MVKLKESLGCCLHKKSVTNFKHIKSCSWVTELNLMRYELGGTLIGKSTPRSQILRVKQGHEIMEIFLKVLPCFYASILMSYRIKKDFVTFSSQSPLDICVTNTDFGVKTTNNGFTPYVRAAVGFLGECSH